MEKTVPLFLLLITFIGCNQREEQPKNEPIKEQPQKTVENVKKQPPPVEYKDITKEMKKIFKVSNPYNVLVEEAKISSEGKIAIRAYFEKESLSLAHLVMSEHSNMSQIIAYFTFNSVFKTTKLILKKFPETKEVNYTYLDIEEKRDKYGNKTNDGRKPLYDINLTAETTNKINFDYVKELLSKVYLGGDYKELSQMLDGFYSYPD